MVNVVIFQNPPTKRTRSGAQLTRLCCRLARTLFSTLVHRHRRRRHHQVVLSCSTFMSTANRKRERRPHLRGGRRFSMMKSTRKAKAQSEQEDPSSWPAIACGFQRRRPSYPVGKASSWTSGQPVSRHRQLGTAGG